MTSEQEQLYKLKQEQAQHLQVGDVLQCKYPWPRPGEILRAGTKFLIQEIKSDLGTKRLHLIPQTGATKEEIWISLDLFLIADFLILCHED